jgi:MtN3 and saliva related transmembrane protein
MINTWSFIGLAAAVFTSTSFIPQTITRLRDPKQARVSYLTLGTLGFGAFLWLLYGIHLRDWIIIGANGFIDTNLVLLAGIQWAQERKIKKT